MGKVKLIVVLLALAMLVGCGVSESEYKEEMKKNLEGFQYVLEKHFTDSKTADRSKIINQLDKGYVYMGELRSDVQSIKPPNEYEKEHEYIIDMMIAVEQFFYFYREYTGNQDPSDMKIAKDRMVEFGTMRDKADRLIQIIVSGD